VAPPTLFVEDLVKLSGGSLSRLRTNFILRGTGFSLCTAVLALVAAFLFAADCGAQAAKPARKEPGEKQVAPKPAESEKNPAQIELLETKYRFEANGASRKEVHARVKINSELGVRQFGRLNFDFNRSFQSLEIPLVRVTHSSGGVQDILPGAITDNPNPAVVDAPAYQDVRVKSVRILGLQPGDSLEYRVITTTTHHPLAPDFWLDHSFDRAGIVTEEHFEIDLPRSRFDAAQTQALSGNLTGPSSVAGGKIRISPKTPATKREESGTGDSARVRYVWQIAPGTLKTSPDSQNSEILSEPDVVLTTFSSWQTVGMRLSSFLDRFGMQEIENKERELVYAGRDGGSPVERIYAFVSKKIKTIDLPLGSTGFATRKPEEILKSGYGTPEDKFALFSSLIRYQYYAFCPLLLSSAPDPAQQLPRPSVFVDVIAKAWKFNHIDYFDMNLEVAPFSAIRPDLRGKTALAVYQTPVENSSLWTQIPGDLPFPSEQHVGVTAEIGRDGKLMARVKYALRGDNEILLRVAFHKTPKDKWKDVAQLLAISDGFRGEITNVAASDPYVTNEPFQVEYEIAQLKFVDWTKKPVRIPALLPAPGLPDPPNSAAQKPIELGTPLEIELNATLTLPPGVTAVVPTGTTVDRDYATFSSKYGSLKAENPADSNTITAQRKLHFLLTELPATRAADFNAFLHAVQSDQAQLFTLQQPTPTAKSEK
jgi:hypothetical protein